MDSFGSIGGGLNDSLGGTLSESDFENRVENGEFVEVRPGVYQSREAAQFPLGALADYHSKNRGKPPSNVSGAFVVGGGDDDESVNRFRNRLGNPQRHD